MPQAACTEQRRCECCSDTFGGDHSAMRGISMLSEHCISAYAELMFCLFGPVSAWLKTTCLIGSLLYIDQKNVVVLVVVLKDPRTHTHTATASDSTAAISCPRGSSGLNVEQISSISSWPKMRSSLKVACGNLRAHLGSRQQPDVALHASIPRRFSASRYCGRTSDSSSCITSCL